MAQIVSVHSFRGGTGKSNLTANLATLVAASGRTVALVDTDISSPGVHVLFGLGPPRVTTALNDFLWGTCGVDKIAYPQPLPGGRTIHVVPASLNTEDIARILREGYDVERLTDGFRELIAHLDLDVLFVDTHPGLNEETLLSMAVSDTLLLVMRPDQQDYLGTAVTVEVARRLGVPNLQLLVNKTPATFDFTAVRDRVAETYGAEVVGVLPHSDDLMALASEGVFALRHPDHPLTGTLRRIAERVAAA